MSTRSAVLLVAIGMFLGVVTVYPAAFAVPPACQLCTCKEAKYVSILAIGVPVTDGEGLRDKNVIGGSVPIKHTWENGNPPRAASICDTGPSFPNGNYYWWTYTNITPECDTTGIPAAWIYNVEITGTTTMTLFRDDELPRRVCAATVNPGE